MLTQSSAGVPSAQSCMWSMAAEAAEAADEAPRKHDHIDIVTADGRCVRFNDPRRFGVFSWWDRPAAAHPLLRDLGPGPLTPDFSGDYLWRRSRGRRGAVKNFIMDGKVVVGVGNIYASEALFMAGIHPTRPAGRVSAVRRVRSAFGSVVIAAGSSAPCPWIARKTWLAR